MARNKNHDVTWVWRSRDKATGTPDPQFPDGMHVDMSGGRLPSCLVDLPYPGEGLGCHLIRCQVCGMTAAITAAGRVDDPASVTLACYGRFH